MKRTTLAEYGYRQICKFCDNVLHPSLYSIGICGYCLADLEENDDSQWVESYSFGGGDGKNKDE